MADMDAATLFEIAEEVTSSTDLDIVLEKVGVVMKKLLDCDASSIMLLDETKKNLYFKVATGDKSRIMKKLTIPVGVGVAGWVAQNLRPVIIEDVRKDPRFAGQFDKTSGFITKNLICVPMFSKGEAIGIVEVLNRKIGTFGDKDLSLLTHLSGLASVAITNARLVQEQRNFFSHILEVVALGIEALGSQFRGHPWRSQRLAMMLGRTLELTPKEMTDLTHASLLHDIGYFAVRSPRYLDFLGIHLTVENAAAQQETLHPVLGEKMLSGVDVFKNIGPIIRHHHESYDGTGFPDKLQGKAIPVGARIVALVEVVEDIRFQCRSMQAEEFRTQVVTEINNISGKKLDPLVCRAFLDLIEDIDIL
ncbi:MAG: HD domain-containing phosphohydrolase [Elusimicrobiota bacterium]